MRRYHCDDAASVISYRKRTIDNRQFIPARLIEINVVRYIYIVKMAHYTKSSTNIREYIVYIYVDEMFD